MANRLDLEKVWMSRNPTTVARSKRGSRPNIRREFFRSFLRYIVVVR